MNLWRQTSLDDKMEMKKSIIFLSGVILGLVILTLVFYFFPSESKTVGCWKQTKTGHWVCVNIEEVSYERAVEVCKHEVGHEIFAEECEKNMTKCLEVFE